MLENSICMVRDDTWFQHFSTHSSALFTTAILARIIKCNIIIICNYDNSN